MGEQARSPAAPDKAEVAKRLHLIFDWYRGMIDEKTGRLIYIYEPDEDLAIRDRSPIRDLGSMWDIEVLGRFLKRDELETFAHRSLAHYCSRLIGRQGYAFLNPDFLGEPSGIAHNAFLLLSLLFSTYSPREEHIRPLADGVVKQQRRDGSYKVYFGDEEDDGLDLYPGEAMLALMEAFKETKDARYLESVEKGFSYYKTEYYERGLVAPRSEVFFANWQSQYCRLLYEATGRKELKDLVKEYVFTLHDRIIARGFYKKVERRPRAQFSVEVACALEGICDALSMAVSDPRAGPFRDPIRIALSYLVEAQCTQGCTAREKGGFGFSLTDRSQRIDIAGHAASGFMKSIDSGAI